MKSDRMSFNTAVARNTLRRCWPLWAAYLIYLIITLPVSITSYIRMNSWQSNAAVWKIDLNSRMLNLGLDQAKAAIVIGMLAVMVLFGYLYNSRGNTLMNSLPVKRGSLFLTLYLTGLLPMLLCQLLVLALTAAMTAGAGIDGINYFRWLGCAALGLIFFYGFSCFCAMLTGNLVVLPAVYLVLNFTAFAFESCFNRCVSALVFGLTGLTPRFQWLSPLVYLSETNLAIVNRAGKVCLAGGMKALWLYAAAGLLFSLLAGLLYRKRRMECVSDIVAIPVLKPIFRICMALGTAFVCGAALFENFFERTVFGSAAAWLMAFLLILGAVIGWAAAEMMIRRSVRVFPLPWKGLAAVCAVCVLTVLAAETDLTGYEKRIPDPEQVENVEICFETRLSEPENIRALEAVHQEIIEKKAMYDSSLEAMPTATLAADDVLKNMKSERMTLNVPIIYKLAGGKTMVRNYNLICTPDDVDDPSSTVGKIVTLLNCREALMSRMKTAVPFEKKNVQYAVIEVEEGTGGWNQVRLSAEDIMDLWENAMLPDAEEGRLSLYTVIDTDENLSTQTNMRIEISLSDAVEGYYDDSGEQHYWYHSFRVFTFSDRCLEWIREHTELEWKTLKEVREQQLAYESGLKAGLG